jgi:hypothetical protein
VFVLVIVFLLAQVFSLRRRVRCRGSQTGGWLASRAEEPATTSGRLFA